MLLYVNSTDGCVYNANLNVIADGGEPALETKAAVAAGALSQLTIMLWFGMHIFGGMIRSMTHIEPYYESPEDPDAPEWKVLMF
jgi:hypothetical protein